MSVIVVVYNQIQTLKLCLKSLLQQEFGGTHEVIVSDDGSSGDLLNGIRDELNAAPIPIKYTWQQDRHFRAAAARNNGIRLARGRLLVFLDGDMIPALDMVEKHVQAHTTPKRLVAGNRKWRGAINDAAFTLLDRKSINEVVQCLEKRWEVDPRSRSRERNERQRRRQWLRSAHPWRACFSGNVSVAWAPEVHFDENFVGWGPEDWEFNYRLCVQHGYDPLYRDDITTYHLETANSVGNVFRRGTHEEIVRYMRNTCYFFDRCRGLPLKDVFFGFPRFRLIRRTDMWRVRAQRPDPASYNLEEVVRRVRRWLAEHKVYP